MNWDEFVELFQGSHNAPTALVMSACCGASTALGNAFAAADRRPKIILGSSDDRRSADYVAAWALLYRAFRAQGIKRRVAQEALAGICATVHHNFRYLRWDDDRERYRQYPGAGKLFEITERT